METVLLYEFASVMWLLLEETLLMLKFFKLENSQNCGGLIFRHAELHTWLISSDEILNVIHTCVERLCKNVGIE